MDCESLLDNTGIKSDDAAISRSRRKKRDSEYNEPPDDMASLIMGILKRVNFKIAVLLFMVFIFLNTSSFIDSGLTNFENAVDGRLPTEKGIVIQGVVLVLIYIVLGLLVDADLI